jgi:hypothetical protein
MSSLGHITPEQAAEFRGLFFGEGHIDLARPGHGSSLMPRLRIAVRDDDAKVVEWCRALFGGNLSRSARTRSVCWQLTGRAAVLEVAEILEGGTLPSKKRAEVALLKEALALVPRSGRHIKPDASARLHVIREELKSARVYVTAHEGAVA